ncbi:hypothetical protein P171DRAFT_100393 [Karstenula rhodostoma CBS 690.94]|uniref:RING-type domain-containing protein n=1 Tax=Karstenula rhodostoma CBS 690.94 TaxID=1392251 RepID=A0A9P4U7R3_9PLEO|nr:hypothetical protein P171DRAFT_100393 [Karstenula rhodostoma CBS 690.94]
MFNRAPNPQSGTTSRSSFILFTTPVRLASLGPEHRTCPICLDEYIEPQDGRPDPSDTNEWALRVEMSITDEASTTCCRHLFGQWCLQKHINSREPWHNTCPICRLEWWKPPRSGYVSPKSIRGVGYGRVERRGGHSVRRGARSPRASIVRQVMKELAVDGGRAHVDMTVQKIREKMLLLFQERERAKMASMRASLNAARQSEQAHPGSGNSM